MICKICGTKMSLLITMKENETHSFTIYWCSECGSKLTYHMDQYGDKKWTQWKYPKQEFIKEKLSNIEKMMLENSKLRVEMDDKIKKIMERQVNPYDWM